MCLDLREVLVFSSRIRTLLLAHSPFVQADMGVALLYLYRPYPDGPDQATFMEPVLNGPSTLQNATTEAFSARSEA